MHSVTSNAVARTIFPDYSVNLNTISSADPNGFTAPCDCYIVWGMVVDSSRHITINGNQVGWYDKNGDGVCGFSGFIKEGDVVKDAGASGYAIIKNFLKAYRIH